MEALMPRRRFTVDEFECMGRAGILHEDERVELIDGEIIQMAAMGSRHAGSVDRLTEWSIAGLAGRAHVRVQNPVRLDPHGQPQPDLAIVRRRPDRYFTRHPGPEDVFLIVEVADSSLDWDGNVKLHWYAAAGIPEVWIVDLEGERVLVFRRPSAQGYQETMIVTRGGSLSPDAFPDMALAVDSVLG